MRRRCWIGAASVRMESDGRLRAKDGGLDYPRLEEVLADDWEILEPTVTITRQQFWEAVRSAFVSSQANETIPPIVGQIARRLGLEGPNAG